MPENEETVIDMGYHTTDLGNTDRMFDQFRETVRWSPERKMWLHWTGQRWEWDRGTYIVFLAKEVVKSIYHEAADTQDDARRQELAKWALKSESERAISAMVELFKTERGIPIRLSDIDADCWLLNCRNGTIDLQSGELLSHSSADYLTRLIDVDYNPDTDCPLWTAFLDKVTGGDIDLQQYLQRAIGYSLTADTSSQVLFFLYGLGNNGKSTFVSTLRTLLGEYAHRASTDTFMQKDKNGGPQESLANLKGKRFVTASELEDGKKLATSLVKDLTGGETISADRKYEHQFEFMPTFKIWLSGNHKPTITDTTLSIWRRVKLIPFTIRILDSEIDNGMAEKLRKEHEGILAWAVKGCLEWQKAGLAEPTAVSGATAVYRNESDILHDFLEDSCVFADGELLSKKELRELYETWCKDNHLEPITQRTFRNRLVEKGIMETRSGQTRYWKGISLVTKVTDSRHEMTKVTDFSGNLLSTPRVEKSMEKHVISVIVSLNDKCDTCDKTDLGLLPDGSGYYCTNCYSEADIEAAFPDF